MFDSDIEYSSQLMNYIKSKYKSINQVRIFTNKTILYDFLLENQIDVLLISEDKLQEDIYHDNINNICILSEGSYISEGLDKNKTIYKFQSARQIVNELFNYFPNLNAKRNNQYSKSKIISIFSLNDTFSKDKFSFNLANQFGISNKVLLIDLNLLHGGYHCSNLDTNKNLSEFLYFLKSRHSNILLKMNMQIQRLGNFDFMKGVMFGPDLYDISNKDLEFWIEELQKSDYDTIIFNIGCFTQTSLELFRSSIKVYLLNKPCPWNEGLYHNLVEQLNWTGYEDIINRIERVEVSKNLTEVNNEIEVNNIFTDQWGGLAKKYAGNF